MRATRFLLKASKRCKQSPFLKRSAAADPNDWVGGSRPGRLSVAPTYIPPPPTRKAGFRVKLRNEKRKKKELASLSLGITSS
jgi:hypothetical protein